MNDNHMKIAKADARTRRLARRLLLGDHPVQMASRIGGHLVRARIRRAFSGRRTRGRRLPERI